ncbi:F-box protein 21 [Exophiala viscosa]|uniref:F-box protein 21 n=1 Tax=Exophiala viscosa TaxID=2486360 RepID=A0AAN6IAI3_9EURO|nr:F-box protein 21 [Exophiala viscosa]
MTSQLTALPDEVIQTILSYLPPSTTLSLQQTCRRFVDVASEPLLWKQYCQTGFRWWHRQHLVKTKFQDASFIDWKPLFATRHLSSQATRNAIGRIVADELGRLDSIKVILDAGYDAKDDLLDMFWNASSSEDHLAQKYWSHAALGCLHRVTAVEEWLDLKAGRAYVDAFEKPLAALDLFILEEQATGDTDDIFARLDSYVASVRRAYPAIDDLSPRDKAATVAEHLLQNKWIGIQDDRHYHSLDHMFLGVALFSGNRNSVPLISAVIYCYVARQFNLRAAPCNYPFHVHALVQPPAGIDLDGNLLSESDLGNTEPSKLTHLYMDPFNSSEPVTLSTLERNLNFVAPTSSPAQKASYLSAATPRDLTIRAAHNILSSPSQYAGPPLHPINPNLATYAALFSLVFLARSTANPPDQLRQHLVVLTQHFLEYFDLDIHLFETYVLPLTISQPDARAYRNLIHQLKDSDHESRPPKSRSDPRNAVVKFNVGQVFRHRRRHYLAVIYGWDPYCRMQEQWITMNQVDRLPNGRNQPFYNVLVEDESTRYVAEENVVLLSPSEITEDMLAAFPIEIGKWFKRYDPQTATFRSNVRHEYPDD